MVDMSNAVIFSALFASLGSYFLIVDGDPKKISRGYLAQSKDRTAVRSRLNELGRGGEREYQDFRIRQLSLISGLSLFGFTLSMFLGKSFFVSGIFATLLGVSTYLFTERELSSQIAHHRLEIEAEFPAIIEMLSLALSAGQTPLAAMQRISQTANGALSQEFAHVVKKVQTGVPFHIALDEMGRRVHSFLIRRFVDAFITAMLRGAPIIDVLSRHALEARESQRNRVLGAAAKAEISMMIPVVFLILPISILFALWPSLTNLNLFAS